MRACRNLSGQLLGRGLAIVDCLYIINARLMCSLGSRTLLEIIEFETKDTFVSKDEHSLLFISARVVHLFEYL